MKRLLIRSVFRLPNAFFIILLISCKGELSTSSTNFYAITNANIVNVENGSVNENMTLVVKDNKLYRIVKSNSFSLKGIDLIDGSDKFIIPGLWDMHAHSSTDTITRTIAFPLWIANGITGTRIMKADCYEEEYSCEKWGEITITQAKKWQKEINAGALLGPRTILGSNFVNGARNDSSTVMSPGTPEHGREHVAFLKRRGVDFIKIYDEVPRDVYFAVAEEAKKQNMIFAGHVPLTLKASEVAMAGQKSIEHLGDGNLFEECSLFEEKLRDKLSASYGLDQANIGQIVLEMVNTFDASKCDRVLNILKECGTWFTPTLVVMESQYPYYYDWKNDARLKFLPELEKDLWFTWDEEWLSFWGPWDAISQETLRNKRYELLISMHDKGIPLLAGADSGSMGVFWGSSIHDELELFVQAGLSESEALKTATLNPAKFLEMDDSLGTIEQGKIADIVILDANPLDNIKNIKKINGVIFNGQYLNRSALDSLLLNVEKNAMLN